MQRIGHKVTHYKVVTDIYKYENLREREEHVFCMRFDGWTVLKEETREELGYGVIFEREFKVD